MSDPHDLLLTFSDFQSISGSVQLQPKSEILPWTVTYSFAQFQRNRVTIRTLLIGYLWLMKILQNPAGCCRPLECESANCTTTAQHYHEHAHVTVTKNTSYKRYFAHDSWKSCKILQAPADHWNVNQPAAPESVEPGQQSVHTGSTHREEDSHH